MARLVQQEIMGADLSRRSETLPQSESAVQGGRSGQAAAVSRSAGRPGQKLPPLVPWEAAAAAITPAV